MGGLPKIVGDSISTEMEMKNKKQQSTGGKKNNKIEDDCRGSYAALSVTDHKQPRTVHGMDNHASYAPSSATERKRMARWFITTQQSTTTSS
jgi:hypothetical protein